MLEDLYVGVKALVRGTYTEEVLECPEDINIQWPSDADTELTWLEVVVECGTPWVPCPRCCCCCMCFTPTIIFEAGAFIFEMPDFTTHSSPRMCTTICYQGRVPAGVDVNTPCWYYNDTSDFPGAQCVAVDGRVLGTNGSDTWYGGQWAIIASPISGEGGEPCLALAINFNIEFPVSGGGTYLYQFTYLVTPELLQCEPFHRSSSPTSEGSLSFEGGADIPFMGVGSFWQGSTGNVIVTCGSMGEDCEEL
jgi:hypothetical protein